MEENQEKLKCCREKFWDELTDSEKIERMRKIIKNLEIEGTKLKNAIRKLERHSHGELGNVVIPYERDDNIRPYRDDNHF